MASARERIQRAVQAVLGPQHRTAARQDHIGHERAYMRTLDARIAELNTTLAGGAPSRYLGKPVTDPRRERDACATELAELEDRHSPQPAADPEAG